MNSRLAMLILAVLLVNSPVTEATESATYSAKFMSAETALKAAQAALTDCRKAGFQVAVAVVDRLGTVQVVLRDRYAGAHTPDVATSKAWTAASFKQSTTTLAIETQPGKPMSGIRQQPKVLAAGGGLPINAGGTLFGAIGVSGAPGGDADDTCANAGIKAIADDLEF